MRFPVLYIFLLISLFSSGQKPYSLHFTNAEYRLVKKNPTTSFKDSLAVVKYLQEFRYYAIRKGFLLASADSMRYVGKDLQVHFYTGPRFREARLRMNSADLYFFRKTNTLREKLLSHADFNPSELGKLLLQLQQGLENNGYPFSRVYLDSLEIDSTHLQAYIAVQKGPEVKWTKINLRGENISSERLIASYIQIKPGKVYDQSDVQLISARLKQITFLQEIKPAEVLFTREGAELFLYLQSKPVSLANGIIGLQPNPKTNVLSVTGELRLKLVNVFKKAELIDVNWRSIQAQTQSLKAQVTLPNLFRTPFGIDGQFQLYKRDTTFLELKSTIGIQYALNNGNYIKAFYRSTTSSVLRGGKNNPSFSNLGDVQTAFYGLGLYRQSLDYLPNPSRGFSLLIDGSIGLRKSKQNDTSQVVRENTYRTEIQLQWFIPLAKRHVLRLAGQSDAYFAPVIYQNEVSRFGGQISQRGFNEEELSATSRAVFTAEYRFLVDRNSFAFVFFDQSWYENRSITYVRDTPFGFGTGFSFGTNIGTFSISYALGKQFNNPILLRDGKVHFGYIAYF
jgi:outer membrane protein assembly factor BamA